MFDDSKILVKTPFQYKSDINISFKCKGKPFKLNFKNKGEKRHLQASKC